MKRTLWFLLTLLAGLIFFAIVVGVYLSFKIGSTSPFAVFIASIERFFGV
jgi:hypothetical protein